MRHPSALVVALSLSLSPWLTGAASAGIAIVSESVEVDRDARVAGFTVRFDAEPDFWTLDEFGRVADSFQYEIDDAWDAPLGLPPDGLDAVVRGDEIRIADALRIRGAGLNAPVDPDPEAGGWGHIRGEVPFDLDGSEMRFSVPLATIGDDDGYFAYRLFTTEFGLTTSEAETRLFPPGQEPGPGPGPGPVPIPLPPAVPGAIVTAVLLLGAWLARRHGAATLRSTLAFARSPSGSNVRPK